MPEPLRVNDTRAPPDFELISGRRLIALEYLSGHRRGAPACWALRLDVAVRLVEDHKGLEVIHADRALALLYCRCGLVPQPNRQHQKTGDQQRAREQHGGRCETARTVLQIAT